MSVLEPYEAARRGAAFVDLSARGRIVLKGVDRASYLQGLLTNDVAALGPGEGCYSAWLTPQGRLIADMAVVDLGGELLLDVDAGVTAMLVERLQELVFTEDVGVEDRTAAWAALAVHGPEAARIVANILRPADDGAPLEADALGRLPEYHRRSGRLGDAPVAVVRSAEIGEVGFVLYHDAATARPLAGALAAAGAAELDAETFALLRLEAGRPSFPADMDGSTIPLEAGIESRAISQTKGCYVGQEVIVRILHRGQGRVARRLVGLLLGPGDSPPDAGAALLAPDRPDAEAVGAVTTARRSPALGRPIALGYVGRDLAAAGTRLVAAGDGRRLPAVVTARPFLPLPEADGDG
jgi:folate-binding protein YgfZ